MGYLEDMWYLPPAAQYDQLLPLEGGDLYGVTDFGAACRVGAFTDDDGIGHPVRANRMDATWPIRPSKLDQIPADAESIIWFNK